MQQARTVLDQLLDKSKLEAAIEASLLLARHYGDQDRSATAGQHSGRYQDLKADNNLGKLMDDEYRTHRARIHHAMIDFAQSIPADWTDEALTQAGFSANAYDKGAASSQKSFLEKWGLILGIVASLMGILGVSLQEFIFSKEKTPNTKIELPNPGSANPNQAEPKPENKPKNKGEAPGRTPPVTVPKKPITRPEEPRSKPTQHTPSKVRTPIKGFRSYGISEGMDLGKTAEGKFAFRNVQTEATLCCFEDAEPFKGGKAYVKKDGVYFYIDTSGKKLRE